MKNIHNLLKNKVLILDGATGTELQKRGMPAGACPEKWCIKNPDITTSIHSEYCQAGADIIYSCTFGANRIKLSQYGIKNVIEINKTLVRLAKKAAHPSALVAGDIGPTGQFIEPFGKFPFENAINIFKEQIKGLVAGGADLLVIETMMDIQEARAALIAAKETTNKFIIATMTYERGGKTLNGTDPRTALITLQSLGADAVGINCSTGPGEMLKLIEQMRPYAYIPLVAKPNAGKPQLLNGKTTFKMGANEFASFAKKFTSKGINMIGGCCGTTPAHIGKLKQKLKSTKPLRPKLKTISALSSARKSILIGSGKTLIVGECINPTGKKKFQSQLKKGQTSMLRQLAKDQERNGAAILDVNVGAPGINEETMLRRAINLLSVTTALPLTIDSSNHVAIEKALRLYPGRALINSISGERDKLKKLLPIAAKYGAMFILLPLTEKGIPHTFKKRKKIITNILNQIYESGFNKEDVVIDGLAMTISSNANAANETIKTIRWCARRKHLTVLGISNVSFGMPERTQINTAFLSLAIKAGLTMAIANPLINNETVKRISLDALSGKKEGITKFINYFTKSAPAKYKKLQKPTKKSAAETLSAAVLEGNKDDIKNLINNALRLGLDADSIIHKIMVPAINRVGLLFDKKEYFLPQLIASAETMKTGFEYLQPKLKKKGIQKGKKTVILLATVKGDIHDIGKNIVALMLKNHGFKVIDLGKDISSEKIIKEVKRHKHSFVGLSALMTTTMVNMKKVIDLAKKEKLACRFVVGGAVITKSYAHSIGAEYAKDGVEAVRILKKLSNTK